MSDNFVNSHVPSIPCMGGTHTLAVVLMQGQRGEFVAYEGIVSLQDYRAEANREAIHAWVAGSGRKLRYTECVLHFPGIKPEQYRA